MATLKSLSPENKNGRLQLEANTTPGHEDCEDYNNGDSKSGCSLYKCLEVLCLASVILILLGLYMTSIIYFIISPVTFPIVSYI